MKIENNTIYFKSIKEMYEKELDGRKTNTVRILTLKELQDVLEKEFRHIRISMKDTDYYFTRIITDISYIYSENHSLIICIFSWNNYVKGLKGYYKHD